MSERFAFNPPPQAVPAAPAVPWFASQPADEAPARPRRDTKTAERRDWSFVWTLVFTAVLFLRPQDIFEPLGALHLAEVSAMLGLIALFSGRLARRQPLTRMTPELAGVLAFGAVMLLTAPFSIWFGGAVGVFQELYVKVILVYLLAVNVLTSPKRLEQMTWVLVLALGYLGFRAVVDYVRGVNVIRGGTRVMGSVGGLMQNPNDMALNMVSFLPLAAFIALQPGRPLKRLIAAGCAFSMMGAIVATGSRGGFLGFAAMMVVLVAFGARKRPGLVLAGMVAILCSLPVLPDTYWRRIASITDESKDDVQSSQARRRLMGESWDAFVENPLVGVGAGQFKDWNPQGRVEAWHEAHNVWLQVSAELGIFGVAIFTFLVCRAFSAVIQTRRLLRRTRPPRRARQRQTPLTADEELLDAHSAAMVASVVGWFVCAFFASVAYNWTFYYLLALSAAPAAILRQRLPAVRRRPAAAAALTASEAGA